MAIENFLDWVVSYKHLPGKHDQKTHGNWARGREQDDDSVGMVREFDPFLLEYFSRVPREGLDPTPKQLQFLKVLLDRRGLTLTGLEGADRRTISRMIDTLVGVADNDYFKSQFSQFIPSAGDKPSQLPEPEPPKPPSEKTIEETVKMIKMSQDSLPYDPNKEKGKVELIDDKIVITTPFDKGFTRDINTVPTARWDAERKVWTVDPKYRKSALEVFEKHFNHDNERTMQEEKLNRKKVIEEANMSVQRSIENQTATAEKPLGKIDVRGENVVIETPYDPDFVKGVRKIDGASWDEEKKVWTVPVSETSRALSLFEKFYQHRTPETEKLRAQYEKEMEEKRKKLPATDKQISFINELLRDKKYITPEGYYATAADIDKAMTRETASAVIDDLKSSKIIPGLWNGKLTSADPEWFKDDPEPEPLVEPQKRKAVVKIYEEPSDSIVPTYKVPYEYQDLFEKMGAITVTSTGVQRGVNELRNRFGDTLTLGDADDYGLANRRRQYERKIWEKRNIRSKFEMARKTKYPQEIRSYSRECSDPREECNMDVITEWAMPNEKVLVQRRHTW